VDPADGETPPPPDLPPEGVKTRANAIGTGPRSTEVRSEEKRKKRKKKKKEQPK
jgi:hypothetical protein